MLFSQIIPPLPSPTDLFYHHPLGCLSLQSHREKLCTLSPAYGCTSLKMTSKS